MAFLKKMLFFGIGASAFAILMPAIASAQANPPQPRMIAQAIHAVAPSGAAVTVSTRKSSAISRSVATSVANELGGKADIPTFVCNGRFCFAPQNQAFAEIREISEKGASTQILIAMTTENRSFWVRVSLAPSSAGWVVTDKKVELAR